MTTVVGLFGRRRDALYAWILLQRHGFRISDVRVVPCDRFVQERLHPTISYARTLHERMCASGGTMFGSLVGMLGGALSFAATDPRAVFMLSLVGAGAGGFGGWLVGRYDPLNFAFAKTQQKSPTPPQGAILICVAAYGERAVDADAVLRQSDAIKVFGSEPLANAKH